MAVDTRSQIRSFVTGAFPSASIGDDDDIFALGIANSLFAMQLVMFVENSFAMQVPNEDLEIDNFRSIAAVARLVDRQRGVAASA